jgi:hypothetical protein
VVQNNSGVIFNGEDHGKRVILVVTNFSKTPKLIHCHMVTLSPTGSISLRGWCRWAVGFSPPGVQNLPSFESPQRDAVVCLTQARL